MTNPSDRIDPAPGIYTLIAALSHDREIRIGALGSFLFASGTYAYTGSAMGPGGLQSRLGRHLRTTQEKKTHWHIDYLLQYAVIRAVCWAPGSTRSECEWAARTASSGGQFPPRFGASDCGCPGHLVHLAESDPAQLIQLFREPLWKMTCMTMD